MFNSIEIFKLCNSHFFNSRLPDVNNIMYYCNQVDENSFCVFLWCLPNCPLFLSLYCGVQCTGTYSCTVQYIATVSQVPHPRARLVRHGGQVQRGRVRGHAPGAAHRVGPPRPEPAPVPHHVSCARLTSSCTLLSLIETHIVQCMYFTYICIVDSSTVMIIIFITFNCQLYLYSTYISNSYV